MKKVVLKLDLHDDKEKQKAMKTVSALYGVDSIAIDMKEKKVTIIGDFDPIVVVGKLRKSWHAEILSVGPAKVTEKKNDNQQTAELVKVHTNYNPHSATQYYNAYSTEENPNACVIS